MFEITGVEQKRCWDESIMPPVENVRPGLWSIPVPIPDSPLRYVLVYALELAGEAGVAIIDAGWNTEAAWTALTGGLTQVGFGIADVRAVLVTHIHPDHFGLAGRVRENSGAWVALHPADAAMIPSPGAVPFSGLISNEQQHHSRSGVPPLDETEIAAAAAMMAGHYASFTAPDVLLEDGDRPELPGWDLRAIWTPGHSPGHLCFADAGRGVVLTGDHVLPRITPNIARHPHSGPRPLASYLDSLARIARLEEEFVVEEVLPAHEYRFRGLADRAGTIAQHHHERLEEMVKLLVEQPGPTSWELTARMRWSRPWADIPTFMRRGAAGETDAHLELLADGGRIHRVGDQPGRWFTGPAATASG